MNYLDIAFAVFTLIFVVTAFFRGFVKEIFSLLNWIVALTLSYLLYPYIAKFFYSYSDNKLIIDIIAQIVIFIAAFLVTLFALGGPNKTMQEKMPKIFDRSLGVFYGLIKTLLIFGLAYSITANLYGFLLGKNSKKKEKLPGWVTESKCHSILQLSGETVDPIVKKFFNSVTKNFDQIIPEQKNVGEKNELDEKIDDLIDSGTADADKKPIDKYSLDTLEKTGYSKKDIEKMNRLIEIIDK